MKDIIKYTELRERLDEIDRSVVAAVSEPIYKSKLRILIGMWEKGEAILISRGVDFSSFYKLEKETGRSQPSLKRWYDLRVKYPDKQEYIGREAEPKAKEWVANLLLETPSEKPHISQNSGDNEWDTPAEYIDAARTAMGSIDTDPATNEEANNRIQATLFYTSATDGRDKPWQGNVWMNPPYAQPLIAEFCAALVSKYNAREFNQACILVNNATETAWFQSVLSISDCVCFPAGRIKFIDKAGGPSGTPLQGQAIIYVGDSELRFKEAFSKFGPVLWAHK